MKEFLKKYFKFYIENLRKKVNILIILSVIFIFLSLLFNLKETNIIVDGVILKSTMTFLTISKNKIILLAIGIVAGVVPYFYISAFVFVLYLYNEFIEIYTTASYFGLFSGTLRAIVPVLLNMFVISLSTALGIYICKVSTVKYKISQTTNMNWTNFRIKFFEASGNTAGVEKLKAKQDERLKKLNARDNKFEYINIFTTIIFIVFVQIISSLIQAILI